MKTTVVNVRTFAGFNLDAILRSVGIAYISTIALLAIFSALLAFTQLSEAITALGLVLTAIISNVIAGMLISRKSRNRGWLNGALGGSVYVLILYIIGAIFYNSFAIGAGALLMLATCLISGAVGGIIGVNSKHRR